MSDREEWIAFCCVPSKKVAHELGLVILATKNHYRVVPLENRYYLLEVQAEHPQQVYHQVSLYCEEVRQKGKGGRGWSLPKDYQVSVWPFVAVFILLSGIHVLGTQEQYRWLHTYGRMDSFAVLHNGQWWRVLTTLGLHKDIAHLAGNLGFGAIFAWFVVKRWGNRKGWWFVLLSGILGNVLLAMTYFHTQHLSIGASTAVMGAIGLLTGASVKEWKNRSANDAAATGRFRPVGVSLFASLLLFSLLGGGGGAENIDVAAHLWGWLAGIVIGYRAVRTGKS